MNIKHAKSLNEMNIRNNQTSNVQGITSSSADLLTVGEAASMLRLQVSTIRAWVLHRRIPFVKLGGKRVFFRRGDLAALVAASVVPAKAKDAA
jgi:excisionase family DNA binding protein